MNDMTPGDRAPTVVLLTLFLVLGAGLGFVEAQPSPSGSEREAVQIKVTSAVDDGPSTVRLLLDSGEENRSTTPGFPRRVSLVEGSAEMSLHPPSAKAWKVRAEAPGFWSEPIEVVGEDREPIRSLVLWPATELGADLDIPRGNEPPQQVRVRLAQVPGLDDGDKNQPSGNPEVVCPVEEDEIVGCTVPAGRWNLRLSAPPFAPHFFWDIRLEEEERLKLGELKLKLGGSIYGRITTEAGSIDPKRARVSIAPLVDEEPADNIERRRLHQLVSKAVVQPDGSFQFLGVASGDYRVQATQPGFVGAHRTPVRVERGEWTELREPLYLELPLRLSVQVDPAAEPFGGPWTLYLYRVDKQGRLGSSVEGKTDPSGMWQSPPTPAGDYRIEVRDGNDNSLIWRDLTLSRTSSNARIEIPLVYVEGEVMFDGEPLKGTVWFGGRTGLESVEVESDENGEVYAVLSREGTWRVDVRAESPPIRARGLEVEVETLQGLDVAEVQIEVPNTSVTGRVVDQRGDPPPATAQVYLLPQERSVGPSGTHTDSRGEFELHGMPAGTYQVSAKTDDASARPVTADITEGLERAITLTLHRNTKVTGQVLSSSGPVPGAQVRAFPLTASRGLHALRVNSTQTSANGRFEIEVPVEAEAVRLTVKAQGYALALQRSSDLTGIEFGLERRMGAVELTEVSDLLSAGPSGKVGVLMIDGYPVAVSSLVKWAESRGADQGTKQGSLSVPEMPPGDYSLCRLTLNEATLVMAEVALPSVANCSEGFLNVGSTLRLSPP